MNKVQEILRISLERFSLECRKYLEFALALLHFVIG